jgi:hypothetical protein
MDVYEKPVAETLPSGMVSRMRPPPALSCPVCPAGTPLVILSVSRVAEDEASDPQAGRPYSWLAVAAHCTGCHEEHRIAVPMGWDGEGWTGPARCAPCGSSPRGARRPRPRRSDETGRDARRPGPSATVELL